MNPRTAPLNSPGAHTSHRRVFPTLVALAYIREDCREGGRWIPALHTLVLLRRSDGWAADGGFPDEIAVNEALVVRLNLPAARFERGRLRVTATNGEAVYVPLGESPLEGCVRYGRLYLRQPTAGIAGTTVVAGTAG